MRSAYADDASRTIAEVNSGIRGGSAVIANLRPEVTAALAEAERAIEAFAYAYAAVRRAMATTTPK